jgi:hypothetical protein
MKRFLLVFVLCFTYISIYSQGVSLPKGYRSVELGMSFDDVENVLKKEYIFGYRGERDVSLLPTENRILIETEGSSFLDRCWFQFYDNTLFTIIINFNTEKMDYYSLFSTLQKKYGEPNSLSPEKTIWENSTVRISLERPVSIKYIDLEVFNKLQNQSRIDESTMEKLRQRVLEDL